MNILSPDATAADILKAAEERIRSLSQQIVDLRRAAHDDLRRYDEEHRERQRDRERRLFDEIEPLRREHEAFINSIVSVKGLDMRPAMVLAQAGVTLGEYPQGLREERSDE
jgi:hypothetical protein